MNTDLQSEHTTNQDISMDLQYSTEQLHSIIHGTPPTKRNKRTHDQISQQQSSTEENDTVPDWVVQMALKWREQLDKVKNDEFTKETACKIFAIVIESGFQQIEKQNQVNTGIAVIAGEIKEVKKMIEDQNRMKYTEALKQKEGPFNTNTPTKPVTFPLTIITGRTTKMEENELKKVKKEIWDRIEPRKNAILIEHTRQSAKGNLVIEFPAKDIKIKPKKF